MGVTLHFSSPVRCSIIGVPPSVPEITTRPILVVRLLQSPDASNSGARKQLFL